MNKYKDKILVVGNGSTGVGLKNELYVNNHTGFFLKGLNKTFDVSFVQFGTKYEKHKNLQNFDLVKNKISSIALITSNKINILKTVFKLLVRNKFVYLFYPGSLSKLIAIACIFLRKHYGLYVRGQFYDRNVIDRFILRKSKFLLTVSPLIASDLSSYNRNVSVIKPMISIKKEDLYWSREYSKAIPFKFLFVGRVEERKGITELVNIIEELNKNGLKCTLDIVGGGDQYEKIKDYIILKNLGDVIKLHGLVSNKSELMSKYLFADAFLFTSHDEGFPRVLYEAMASGLPIFTTFVGGIAGRMTDQCNCFEIPVKNSDEAVSIIHKQIMIEGNLKRIGKAGLVTLKELIEDNLITHEEMVVNNFSKI